jgi:NTP pyrophosphatase (non-canonical NTP hydrolase)
VFHAEPLSFATSQTHRVLADIAAERARQDELRDAGRFEFTAADSPGLTNDQRLTMLTEELGEVAREVQNLGGTVHDGEASASKLYTELIQVAAIALAFAEAHT